MSDLQLELRRLSRLARESYPRATMEAAVNLVRATRELLEGTPREAAPARRLPFLELAKKAEGLLEEGHSASVVARMLGWKTARRVRQMVAIARLPHEIHEVIAHHGLEERQLRPLLRWRDSPQLRTLVEWVGAHRLTSRQVEEWVKKLGPVAHPDLGRALAELTAIHVGEGRGTQ